MCTMLYIVRVSKIPRRPRLEKRYYYLSWKEDVGGGAGLVTPTSDYYDADGRYSLQLFVRRITVKRSRVLTQTTVSWDRRFVRLHHVCVGANTTTP